MIRAMQLHHLPCRKPAPEAGCFFTVTIKGGKFVSDTGLNTLCV